MPDLSMVVLILVPAVLAVTVHEVAHGWAALQLGDDTAARAGRLSLNPLRHVDPVGTVLVPITLYVGGEMLFGRGVPFGWAKPVPVDWRALNPLRGGIAAVAIAGPGANLLMIAGWTLIALFAKHLDMAAGALIYMCQAGIIFNAAIMLINLLPIPPLDGSRVVTAALPGAWAVRYNRLETWGLVIVVVLLVSGLLGRIVGPAIALIADLISAFGL